LSHKQIGYNDGMDSRVRATATTMDDLETSIAWMNNNIVPVMKADPRLADYTNGMIEALKDMLRGGI
jgi:hypothetical protein